VRPRAGRYRSGFYWFDDEQKELILASKAAYEKQLGKKITTETAAAADYDKYGGFFYYAEGYHQQCGQPRRARRPLCTLRDCWSPRAMQVPRQAGRTAVLLGAAAVRLPSIV
jgi:peptide methionine sulfoxide reductase MsrA